VWLYHRFPLSLRDVEEMMAQRGVIVSYDTIHQWCRKFGQTYANGLRRRRPPPGDKWHVDEVFIKIAGNTHYLWRAVDQHGNVLDILVTSRRDAAAATRFFRKLLTGLEYVPRVLVTDKLASYGPAHRRLIRSVDHRRSKYLNNRAENSHQPTRAQERPCAGSTRRAGPSGFCPRSAASVHTFALPATGSPPMPTAVRWTSDSPPGTRSPGLLQSPDHRTVHRPHRSTNPCPNDHHRTHLTMPGLGWSAVAGWPTRRARPPADALSV
jgi:putative transposase